MTWRIRWCHFPRRPLLHLALCRHIDGLHAFHDSVELTKRVTVRKVALREVYFCIVSYLRQIRSLRKFKASRFLLTELKSSPSLWWSWGPHRWQVLRCWLYTREQFSHIRNSISDEASGCSWMQRCFLMFNTLLQPIRSLSRLHKPELKKLRTTNHNHTCFFQGFWKITSHVTLTRSGLLLDGWTLCLVLWRSVCVTAGSLFGFYGLFNTACACRGKINEMMNKEKGNENFVLSLSSVCHTRLYEQLSLSLRKQHRWYIFMYKACWVIALIIFIAYEQLLGLSLVFLVPGVKTESSNERKLLLSSWETWNLRSSTAECVCDPDQVSVEPDFTLLVKYKKQSSWLEPRFRLWLGVNISMVTAVVFPTNSTLLLFTDADIFQFSIQSMLFKTTAASRRFIL